MALDPKTALEALKKVQDPELRRDLVTLGMVKDLKIEGTAVSLQVELTTPACPLKDTIAKDVEAALRQVGATRVELSWGARVRSAPGVAEAALTPGVKNIVLVGAGKGGVGKSTVALNLAVSLARMGAQVGILDADIYGPSLPVMTGTTSRPNSKDGKRLEPIVAHGLKTMSIGYLIDPDQALVWRGPMVTGALLQLLRDVNWGELDYLVLDLPPGTGDVPLTLAQNVRAAGVVLVSTPQDVALADVIRAKLMFDKVSIPVLGIVENMSTFVCPHCRQETAIFDHGGVRAAADKLGMRFLGEIPLDLAVREGGDQGVPIAAGQPDGPQAKAFFAAAQQVAGAISVQNLKAPKLPVLGAQPRA
ncbi:Mrp/NBP35 family ATP-binding protein [Anaeromyxobacter diazotrophicus]|uniref:Iron-sulfur cluster carrier protein n=1 Tax=Anaeromyxobacter diazotrophicus TaxID=2590199 RepID=A0A7I9VM05_9BACT|nr:Mrp/NBP35 family ATP-binding protein [Anaeromyxobacter diazotrophicus]GEJ57436.1 iron-sulfur cluster carrier protein [Anaeromyxobacter diazotrophicus]